MVIAGLARRAEAHSAKAGPGNPSGAATQKTVLTSLLRLIMDARVKPGHDAECVALACANVNRPP